MEQRVPRRHFQVTAPVATHWDPATCEDIGCGNWLNGWVTKLDETNPADRSAAEWVRANRAGDYVEERGLKHVQRVNEDGLTVVETVPCTDFKFWARRSPCFDAAKHRKRRDRAFMFIHRVDGGPRIVHTSELNWVEDFAAHQQKLARAAR